MCILYAQNFSTLGNEAKRWGIYESGSESSPNLFLQLQLVSRYSLNIFSFHSTFFILTRLPMKLSSNLRLVTHSVQIKYVKNISHYSTHVSVDVIVAARFKYLSADSVINPKITYIESKRHIFIIVQYTALILSLFSIP